MGLFDNNRIVDLLTNYLRTQFELIKLDVQEAIEAFLIKVVKFIFAAFALAVAFLFILFALAFAINDYFQSSYLGFLLMAVLSLLVGLILFWSFQKQPTFKTSEEAEESTKEIHYEPEAE
ncbi:hypothetical protein EOJ36_03780 [Sandaracinomonas limnophila]|jgi:H+/Cl- antiporter ClcA|uniref:Phage holin family protein n=1 Tax=Sandaracinomonas limnophila TaxID=1862386 RepID=A0A437PTI1_9BACT|nr:phage holin family protein [Sandaracinomonas limnophila]RVU25547.1 hypothetical protein EOJ36_03780 [Sandaracinomonas limnophila]